MSFRSQSEYLSCSTAWIKSEICLEVVVAQVVERWNSVWAGQVRILGRTLAFFSSELLGVGLFLLMYSRMVHTLPISLLFPIIIYHCENYQLWANNVTLKRVKKIQKEAGKGPYLKKVWNLFQRSGPGYLLRQIRRKSRVLGAGGRVEQLFMDNDRNQRLGLGLVRKRGSFICSRYLRGPSSTLFYNFRPRWWERKA